MRAEKKSVKDALKDKIRKKVIKNIHERTFSTMDENSFSQKKD
jgi:hypothetical protein